MAIPVFIIVSNALRLFFQWAIKQIITKYGKQVAVKTFREAMLFLIRRYGNKVIAKMKVKRNGKEIPVEEWIEKGPLEELQNYFEKFGLRIESRIENNPSSSVVTTKSPTEVKSDYYINFKDNTSNRIHEWYTLKGYKMNHLPKTEL